MFLDWPSDEALAEVVDACRDGSFNPEERLAMTPSEFGRVMTIFAQEPVMCEVFRRVSSFPRTAVSHACRWAECSCLSPPVSA